MGKEVIDNTGTRTSFERIVTKQGVNTIVNISKDIWKDYFIPIFGKDKVEFMLANLFSAKTISENINKYKHQYYLIKRGNKDVGYLGLNVRTKDLLITSLYLCPKHRGLSIGREAIQLAQKIAKQNQHKVIRVRVNKENLEAVIATHRLGFIKTGEVCRNIGGSYVMNDIEMELPTD